MRRSPADSTNRSLAAFGKLQHILNEGNPTGDRQVATNQARADSVRRARYLRSSLPFREAAARLRARGLEADHTTLWRWVQRYGPELEEPHCPLTRNAAACASGSPV